LLLSKGVRRASTQESRTGQVAVRATYRGRVAVVMRWLLEMVALRRVCLVWRVGDVVTRVRRGVVRYGARMVCRVCRSRSVRLGVRWPSESSHVRLRADGAHTRRCSAKSSATDREARRAAHTGNSSPLPEPGAAGGHTLRSLDTLTWRPGGVVGVGGSVASRFEQDARRDALV
jgi:hypothetical protein